MLTLMFNLNVNLKMYKGYKVFQNSLGDMLVKG